MVSFCVFISGSQNSQSTQGEHDHQRKLLSSWQIHSHESRNGNDQNGKVGCNMHTSIREPECSLAQAMALNWVIPEFRNRDTVQECTEDRPGSIYTQNRNHYPTDHAHSVCGEYPEILHQDRGFGAENRGVIKWNGEPECLKCVLDQSGLRDWKTRARVALPSSVFQEYEVEYLRDACPFRWRLR